MVTIRNIKEFRTLIDMLISTVHKNDFVEIPLEYSGLIARSGRNFDVEYKSVKNSLAKVILDYKDKELIVSSTTNKVIIQWYHEMQDKGYTGTNIYMAFLREIYEMTINCMLLNGDDILSTFTMKNIVDIPKFMEYCSSKLGYGDISIAISNGEKSIAMTYSDGVFYRLVKMQDKDILFVNKAQRFNQKFEGYYLTNYKYCVGIPDITTQIGLFGIEANKYGKEFKIYEN